MHTLAKFSLFFGLMSAGMAATWTGKLIDASCHDGAQKQQATASCEIMANTASFALQTTDGKVYKLDAEGNTKAAALVSGDLAKFKSAQFKVDGDLDGEMVKVRTLEPANAAVQGVD